MPVGSHSNLRNRSLLTCISTSSSHSLHSLKRGLHSVPFARTTIMHICSCCAVGTVIWCLLPRTLSIINWKRFFLTMLELGAPLSSFLKEMLYKSLNEWNNEYKIEWIREWTMRIKFTRILRCCRGNHGLFIWGINKWLLSRVLGIWLFATKLTKTINYTAWLHLPIPTIFQLHQVNLVIRNIPD